MQNKRRAAWLVFAWAVLAAAWNLYGVRELQLGRPAPGPTASVAGAAILAILALAAIVSARRWPAVFLVACAVALIFAGLGVWGALVGEASQWPSPAWRWGGALLNSFGALAGLAGSALVLREFTGR